MKTSLHSFVAGSITAVACLIGKDCEKWARSFSVVVEGAKERTKRDRVGFFALFVGGCSLAPMFVSSSMRFRLLSAVDILSDDSLDAHLQSAELTRNRRSEAHSRKFWGMVGVLRA